jgi:hypothetical protein
MESFLFDEPKSCVRLLAGALEPTPFRVAIQKELKMEGHRKTRADLQMFIDWLIPKIEAFLMFESSLSKDTMERKTRTPDPSKDNEKGFWTGKKNKGRGSGRGS